MLLGLQVQYRYRYQLLVPLRKSNAFKITLQFRIDQSLSDIASLNKLSLSDSNAYLNSTQVNNILCENASYCHTYLYFLKLIHTLYEKHDSSSNAVYGRLRFRDIWRTRETNMRKHTSVTTIVNVRCIQIICKLTHQKLTWCCPVCSSP